MTSTFPQLPQQLGGYRLVRELGRGTSAVVFEGEHVALGKRIAIKLLHADRAANGLLAARFIREGRAAARVRHPHVVDVLDIGEHQGAPYLVMELVEGATLATIFAETQAMPLARLLDHMLPVLAAVQKAHDCGVLHRDLKPANILVGRDRHGEVHPKVADFGISKLASDPAAHAVTEDGTLVGTLAYMAPEQVRSAREVDARADQYALAVVLYQGATGVLPYSAETTYGLLDAIARGDVRAPRALRPELPEGFSDALLRALCTDREGRFPSVRDLAKALLPFASARAWGAFARDFEEPARAASSADGGTYDEKARGSETGDPVAVDEVMAPHRPRPKRGAMIAGGAMALVALVFGARIYLRGSIDPPKADVEASAARVDAPPRVEQSLVVVPPLASAAPIPTTAPSAESIAAAPRPVAPRAIPIAKRPAPIASSVALNGQGSEARKVAEVASAAASPAPPPKARYELGDHDAPIVE